MPKYEYKVVDLSTATACGTAEKSVSACDLAERSMRSLGQQGWDLVSIVGDRAYMKKEIDDGSPRGAARICANCSKFDDSKREKSDAFGVSGMCAVHKIAMMPGGTCDSFAQRSSIGVGADASVSKAKDDPKKDVPQDEESAWHWQPRTEIGEKRVEAVTSMSEGVKCPSHSHRLLAILGRDRAVVRGKTDMFDGHEHAVPMVGSVEEADGHSHVWNLPGVGC